VLLLAQDAPPAIPADLPDGAKKALREAADVLPYKSFTLQDQVSVRGVGSEQATLKGPGSRQYQLNLTTSRAGVLMPNEISLSVTLFETTPPVPRNWPPRVMRAGFTARLGETVVVGVSPVKTTAGGRALVLLVTPLTPPATGAAAEPSPRQAATFLAWALTSECGTETVYQGFPGESGSASLVETSNVRVERGILSFERIVVPVESRPSPAGDRHEYRVRLRNLKADPEQRPRVVNPWNTRFYFPCEQAGCVAIDDATVSYLPLAVCPEKREDFVKAMRILIAEARGENEGKGGSRK
jgi:hypothetical protein